ncbi:MAG TPA: hypothetical protein VF881_16340, partial [Polyangiaceae bacterium]
MRSRWAVVASFWLLACPGASQSGLSNTPSLNRPWGPEDRGHDVIANGPEACGPTRERPGGSKLPQCPEQANSAGSARPKAPPPPSAPRR